MTWDRETIIKYCIEKGIMNREEHEKNEALKRKIRSGHLEMRSYDYLDREEEDLERRLRSVKLNRGDSEFLANIRSQESISDKKIQELIDQGHLPGDALIKRKSSRVHIMRSIYNKAKLYEAAFSDTKIASSAESEKRKIEQQLHDKEMEEKMMEAALYRRMLNNRMKR